MWDVIKRFFGHKGYCVHVCRDEARGVVAGPYVSKKEAQTHLDRLASQDHESSRYSIHPHT